MIAHYFEEDQFYKQKDLHRLYHELRTPVNHIIGYCELLIEQAEDARELGPVPDLKKIRDAASNWLALVEAYLIEPAISSGSDDELAPPNLALNVGFTFKVPEPRSAQGAFKDEGAILVVDDDEASREMLARRLRRSGYVVSAVGSGLHALSLARRQNFDLVLLDMIMPGLDGFQVLAKFKAEAPLREIPVIMLSALDEENGIARCIEMGAEDYLAKPYNPVFLRARIGACLEKKRLHDKERATFQALQRTKDIWPRSWPARRIMCDRCCRSRSEEEWQPNGASNRARDLGATPSATIGWTPTAWPSTCSMCAGTAWVPLCFLSRHSTLCATRPSRGPILASRTRCSPL